MTKTVCLNMIVKNETKIIIRGLNSFFVKPDETQEIFKNLNKFDPETETKDQYKAIIDEYLICDTGSTDNTIELITNFFKERNIPGKVISEPFKSFSYNRTYALKAAREYSKCDYIFLSDADMEIIIPKEGYNYRDYLTHDEYQIKQGNNSMLYYNTRILNRLKEYIYMCPTHEFLRSPGNCTSGQLNTIYFEDHTDGASRPEKVTRDIRLLTEGLQDPDHGVVSRCYFYLGNTYRESGNYDLAIYNYKKRVECGGWFEECYYSLYYIGQCIANKPKSRLYDAIDAYIKAFEYAKHRLEALYDAVFMLRNEKKFEEAYNLGLRGVNVPYPERDVLFIKKDIYDYKLKDEVALCAFYIRNYDYAIKLWQEILTENKFHESQKSRLESNLQSAKNQQHNRNVGMPKLCFYVGYTVDINAKDTYSTNGFYGSELALIKLSEEFSKYYDVYVFGPSQHECSRPSSFGGAIKYNHSNALHGFMKNNEIEIMIVSRYVNYFVEFTHKANKLYIWLHDMLCQPYWNGQAFPRECKHIIENHDHLITGLIALSPWQKQYVLDHYNVSSSKVFILGNAIELDNFKSINELNTSNNELNTSNFNLDNKTKNRFIWSSASNRGLDRCIEYMKEIKKSVPDVTLYVYRDVKDMSPELIKTMNDTDFIFFNGALDNKLLVKEFQKSEYWFYPTHWLETYCISALEAQMAGCAIVCSNHGALDSTVGDRGVLLNKPIHSDEFKQEAINAVLDLVNNPDKRKELTTKAMNWAKEQTWRNRALEWLSVFGYDFSKTKQELIKQNLVPNRQTFKVKLMSNFCDSNEMVKYLSKMSPNQDYEFVSHDNPDYYCIVNHPRTGDYFDPKKTIIVKMEEKESSRPYFPPEWVDMDYSRYLLVYDKRNSWEWHLDLTYDDLLTKKIEKTKVISAVISSEYRHEGHIKRVEFLKYLEQNNFKLDHYGKDNKHGLKNYIKSLPYHNKNEGILPYKYTFASENVSVDNYATEKIIDGILGECVVFYWGCPNVEKWIDPACYIRLDLNDFKASLDLINKAINDDEWSKRIDKIRQEKRRIVTEEQVLSKISNLLTQSRTNPNWTGDSKMTEFWEWKEFKNPFHGDNYFISFVNYVMKHADVFIETGAYRGASSARIAELNLDKQIYSCEINKDWFELCKNNTSYLSNYNIYNCDSLDLLEKLGKLKSNNPVFFLDAHTNNSTSLVEELKYIVKNYSNYYIFIDDFQVPGKNMFNYNKINNWEYKLENIINLFDKVHIYYPNYTTTSSIYHGLTGWVMISNLDFEIQTVEGGEDIVKKLTKNATKFETRVINLERRPDRWANLVAQANNLNINLDLVRFNAVDGQKLELTDELEELFRVEGPTEKYFGKRLGKHHNYNAAVLGVSLSHYNIWTELASREDMSMDDSYMVLEDDVFFDPEFNKKFSNMYNILECDQDWELLYLGYNDDTPAADKYGDYFVYNNIKRFNPNPSINRWHGGGAYAYMIKKKGAIKMLELARTLKMKQPVDHFMIDQFDQLVTYRLSPFIITAKMYGHDGNNDTDIQNSTRFLKKI